MASDAQTLENAAAAAGYAGLSDRMLLLCLIGVYASPTSLTAQAAVNAAAAAGYAAMSDEQLDRAILAILS